MRLLADMGVSMGTVGLPREGGHDAVHLHEQGLQRLPDAEILKKAVAEERVIVTFDLDFGDLMALGIERAPSVMILRLHDDTPDLVARRLLEILDRRQAELENGALIVIEDARYRMRRLPIGE